jgi:hypothetical protein
MAHAAEDASISRLQPLLAATSELILHGVSDPKPADLQYHHADYDALKRGSSSPYICHSETVNGINLGYPSVKVAHASQWIAT